MVEILNKGKLIKTVVLTKEITEKDIKDVFEDFKSIERENLDEFDYKTDIYSIGEEYLADNIYLRINNDISHEEALDFQRLILELVDVFLKYNPKDIEIKFSIL